MYPAPATTNDDTVEMLKVFFPSPPVPQRSIVSLKSKFISRQSSSKASLNPSISITVGGLKMKDVRKDEIKISF